MEHNQDNGRAMPTARATHALHRARILGLGLTVGISIAGAVFADFVYFRGFDQGADGALCITAYQTEGAALAAQEHSCKNIRGIKLPPRIFPGTNGDEPTIWSASVDRSPEGEKPQALNAQHESAVAATSGETPDTLSHSEAPDNG